MKKSTSAEKSAPWSLLSVEECEMICGGAAPQPDPGPDPNGTAGQSSGSRPTWGYSFNGATVDIKYHA